jgi:hypothetical protein
MFVSVVPFWSVIRVAWINRVAISNAVWIVPASELQASQSMQTPSFSREQNHQGNFYFSIDTISEINPRARILPSNAYFERKIHEQ